MTACSLPIWHRSSANKCSDWSADIPVRLLELAGAAADKNVRAPARPSAGKEV
jgi:hypothetical protein